MLVQLCIGIAPIVRTLDYMHADTHICTYVYIHLTYERTYMHICDWICEKGSYTRNYKYLEIQF